MHDYLRAVGFSGIRTRKDLDKVLGLILSKPSSTKSVKTKYDDKHSLVEKSLDFSDGMGIQIRGEYDEKGFFHLENYFPYLRGRRVSTYEEITLNKKVDTFAFLGTADHPSFGVALMFYLLNSLDYYERKARGEDFNTSLPLRFSALSLSGTILFPIRKTEEQARLLEEESRFQSRLMIKARKGDEKAINLLTIRDMKKNSMLSRRVLKEDLYSIVDSYFMPYGAFADHFKILGEIKEVISHKNLYTGEELTELVVRCNATDFFIGINNADLLGEPKVGRRFKGTIWLQGIVDFNQA